MSLYKKKFFWWWSWNSDKFENYLGEMSKQGWEVESTSAAHTVITFKKTKPQNISYCVDYQNKYTDEYSNIIKDDGWRLISKRVGWVLWAKPYKEEKPAVFTDTQSLIDRNKRLLKFIGVLTIFQVPGFINLFYHFNGTSTSRSPMLYILYVGAMSFMVFALFKIHQHNKQLKEGI